MVNYYFLVKILYKKKKGNNTVMKIWDYIGGIKQK